MAFLGEASVEYSSGVYALDSSGSSAANLKHSSSGAHQRRLLVHVNIDALQQAYYYMLTSMLCKDSIGSAKTER